MEAIEKSFSQMKKAGRFAGLSSLLRGANYQAAEKPRNSV
jgi:hypothetical protein